MREFVLDNEISPFLYAFVIDNWSDQYILVIEEPFGYFQESSMPNETKIEERNQDAAASREKKTYESPELMDFGEVVLSTKLSEGAIIQF